MAEYPGEGKRHPYIVDIECEDCPVSCITAESRQLVDLYMRGESAKIHPGHMVYGPDPSKWPARFTDAMEVLRYQDMAEQSARFDAERR